MQAQAHWSRRFLLMVTAVLGACTSGTEPPTPTSMVVRTSTGATSATLASLGQTVALTAKVVDQFGDTMTGQTVTWSTGAATVATVSGTGTVTAVANGSAQITATAGQATGSLGVTVAQVVAAVQKQSGDAQTGTVATALGQPLAVKVVDGLGVGIAGATLNWAIASGGGTLTPSGSTDAQGVASATWTPGTTAGSGSITATSSGVTATFTATLQAGPAAQITIVSGNNQSAAPSTAVAIQPRVRVADQHGNVTGGVLVTWAVTGGGGSVNPTSGNTATNGEAATAWTLGPGTGANALQASIAAGANTSFAATASAPGGPTAIAIFAGDNQTALAMFPTNIRPAVRVTDGSNIPVAGLEVVFTPSAGGSVTGGTDTTNANGVAQVGSWTPGATAGAATLGAAVTSTALQATFNGTAANAAYDIDVRNIGPAFSAPVQAAFDSATAIWERAIYGDLLDIPTGALTNVCNLGVNVNETVDDILILARFDSIDGPLNIVGQAGDCGYLRTSNGLAVIGQMVFDTADVATLITGGLLPTVIVHEMGHVLGFSAFRFDLTMGSGFTRDCIDLQSTGSPPSVVSNDTHFTCPLARAMFDSIGGTNYTGGLKVPLENCQAGVPSSCGPGTYNSHWREATFFNELMTGYINGGVANPLSALTITSFEDLGYRVNLAGAAAYSRVFSAPAAARGPGLDLGNDVIQPREIIWMGSSGVIRRVRVP